MAMSIWSIHPHGASRPYGRANTLKLFFGQSVPYAKDFTITPSDVPADTLDVQQPEDHPVAFLLASEKLSQMLKQQGPVGAFLGNLLHLFVKSTPAQTQKVDGNGNIISLLKDGSLTALQKGFQHAFYLVPETASELAISAPDAKLPPEQLAFELAKQAALEEYNLNLYRQNSTHPFDALQQIVLRGLPLTPDIHKAIAHGKMMGEAMNLTRYLVDAPPDTIKSPAWISQQAKALASPTLTVDVHDRAWIQQQKMGLFLAVASGNRKTGEDSPRLVEMVYTPPNGKYDKTILLVGKGITFDTGGTNLKVGVDAETGYPNIHGMKGDMAGAAAVIGTMKAINEMHLENVRVIGLTPLTPNRLGAYAMLPNHVAIARNGKRVEIENTDAEGRLVLSDSMNYGGEKYHPDVILDIATLTGGKAAALGRDNSIAVMGNNYRFSKQLSAISRDLGRKAIAYPLTEGHRRWVTKGAIPGNPRTGGLADVYNSVPMKEGERYGLYGKVPYSREKHIIHHSLQGGAFLREFLADPKTPWGHLDIAGSELAPVNERGGTEYATGIGVEDLFQAVQQIASGNLKT